MPPTSLTHQLLISSVVRSQLFSSEHEEPMKRNFGTRSSARQLSRCYMARDSRLA